MAPRRKAGAASSSGAATALKRKAAPKSPAPAGAGATANKRRRVEREFLVGKLQAGEVFTFGSNPFGALGLGEHEAHAPRRWRARAVLLLLLHLLSPPPRQQRWPEPQL